jgi:hypothetical protein
MEEQNKQSKKHQYYLKNKDKWKKGGKYYNYTPKHDRVSDIKLEVRHGKFIISFD